MPPVHAYTVELQNFLGKEQFYFFLFPELLEK